MKIFLIDGLKYTASVRFNYIRSYHPSLQFSNESKDTLKEWCEVGMFLKISRPGLGRRSGAEVYTQAHWDKELKQWEFERELISPKYYRYDRGPWSLSYHITDCIEVMSDSEYYYWGFPDSFAPAVQEAIPHILLYLGRKAERYYKALTEENIVDSIRERNTVIFEDEQFWNYFPDMKKRVDARRAVA